MDYRQSWSLSFGLLLALFLLGVEGEGGWLGEERAGQGGKCSRDDIVVYQGQTDPLRNGIPTYTAHIVNVCSTGCSVSNLHLSCGWFSSARLINPKLFSRLSHNDCLVNDGKPIPYGQTISIQYANTFLYPMAVSTLTCS